MRLSPDIYGTDTLLHRFVIVFCLILLLLLAGCSVNEGDNGTSSFSPVSPSPEPSPPPEAENQPPAPTAPAIDTTIDTPGRSQISANDPDVGQTHTYEISQPPTHGSATFDDDVPGLLVYTPDTGFTGSDSLEVTVTDDGDPPLSATVTIDITVRAGAPTDLNGDGFPDLVTANQFASSITVLFGQADNTFVEDRTVSPVPTGTAPVALAVTDLNADGRLDLMTANQAAGTVSIFFGQSDGTFDEDPDVPPLPTGAGPTDLAVIDLNTDGRLDLITANRDANNITVRFGRSDGTFGADPAVPPIATGANPVALVVTDLNADGRLDLMTANQAAGTVSIFFGQPDGTFDEDPDVSPISTNSSPVALAVADLNADDRLDLVTANQFASTVTVFFAQRDGTFALAPNVPPISTGTGPADLAVVK